MCMDVMNLNIHYIRDHVDGRFVVGCFLHCHALWGAHAFRVPLLQAFDGSMSVNGVDTGSVNIHACSHVVVASDSSETSHPDDTVRALLALLSKYAVDPPADGITALRVASANGHEGVAQELLAIPHERGVDPSANSTDTLCWASERGDVALVQVLLALPLERGVDPAAADNVAIRLASKNGHAAVVQTLLALPPARGVDAAAGFNYAFHMASANGHVAVIHVLLAHVPGSATVACLHAARRHWQWDVVALLLERGLDCSHEDWLELQLSCAVGGRAALLARASYLQRRDAFVAHQHTWRR